MTGSRFLKTAAKISPIKTNPMTEKITIFLRFLEIAIGCLHTVGCGIWRHCFHSCFVCALATPQTRTFPPFVWLQPANVISHENYCHISRLQTLN
jgi:hypothetical protein